ncbi:IS3 family transposase [Candidatus Poriferisodalis sp.]|uniref:IS3 family transposase n=1 Tax=Candidatus Poriferisodalis sp. TaxID=3101277 RepID=UPI003B022F5F
MGRLGSGCSCAGRAGRCRAGLWRPPWPARAWLRAPRSAGGAERATARLQRDLIGRDFTAAAPDQRWVGDFKEIPTGEGKVHLATVMDLYSRRIVGFATSDRHPTAKLAQAAIEVAVATRGGDVAGVIFHTDKGSQYTAGDFAKACDKLDITRSTGRVGCALDNAAAESLFSTLTHELLYQRDWATRRQARQDIARWITDWYNTRRLHSTLDMTSPTDYENTNTD